MRAERAGTSERDDARTRYATWAFLLLAVLAAGMLRARFGGGVGNQGDMQQWIDWADQGARHPLGEMYATTPTNYPPGYVSILWGIGKLRAAFPRLTMPGTNFFLMKVPAIVADLLVGLLLFGIGARCFGHYAAAWIAALYLFNPAVISDSTIWGQTDGLVPVLPLLALALIDRGAWYLVGPVLAAALTIKFQSIVFVVALFGFLLADFGILRTAASAVGAVLTFLLLSLPFVLTDGQFRPMIEAAYLQNVDLHRVVSLGALNFWHIAEPFSSSDDLSLVRLAGMSITPKQIGLFLFVLAAAPAVLAGSSCRRISCRAYALGMAGWAFFTFPTQIHERYLLPAIAFFALAAPRHVVPAALFAATSGIHLYSCYFHDGPLDGVISASVLPLFLFALLHLRHSCRRDDADSPQPRVSVGENLFGRFAVWTTSHVWVPTLLLALATGIAALGVSGRLHAWFGEVPLARIGAFRSPDASFDRDRAGGPLRIAGRQFDEGIQTGSEPARFVFPPGFGRLTVGMGLQDGEPAGGGGPCKAEFVVRSPGKELYRSTPIARRRPPQWAEIPLPYTLQEMTLSATASGCSPGQRFDWIGARLVSWETLHRSENAKVVYLSDMQPLRIRGAWQRDRSIRGMPIRIAGREYERGIGVHAESALDFEVPEGSCTFAAAIGYDEEVGVHPDWKVRFLVLVDGKEAYRSSEVAAGDRAIEVRVPVESAERLTLLVDSLESVDGDHADWGGARFVRRGSDPTCNAVDDPSTEGASTSDPLPNR